MGVKMECDNCHTQVTTEGVGNHGWVMVSQQLVFNTPGETPIQGTFCTVSCASTWLQSKDPTTSMRGEEVWGHEKAQQEYDTSTGMTVSQFTGKAGEILRKVVGSDEPIAIFRAQDLLSIFPLARYAQALEEYGAHYDQQESWGQVREEFKLWQNAHASRVRLPD